MQEVELVRSARDSGAKARLQRCTRRSQVVLAVAREEGRLFVLLLLSSLAGIAAGASPPGSVPPAESTAPAAAVPRADCACVVAIAKGQSRVDCHAPDWKVPEQAFFFYWRMPEQAFFLPP